MNQLQLSEQEKQAIKARVEKLNEEKRQADLLNRARDTGSRDTVAKAKLIR